jgi:polyprenyl-phospho-N-acetylgalactosaminyl synthase
MAVTADDNVWIVVPAFREAKAIRRTVGELRQTFPNVVVVDDGSPDSTADEALAAGAVVIRHPFNLGQGAALQTGMRYAVTRRATHVVTFDADGQHHVEDIVTMLDVLRKENVDIVLGSRFAGHAEGMSASRRLLLKAAVVFTNITTGVRLSDAHNGLRAMTGETAGRFQIEQDQMAHASEFIAEIGRLGLSYQEVPVTITYTDYSVQKGQKLSNSFRILIDLVVGWLLR